jgi:hypothetical protein
LPRSLHYGPQKERPFGRDDKQETATQAQTASEGDPYTSKPKSQVQERYLGPRGKTGQNRDTNEKSKNCTLKNQGCGTRNPSGDAKPPLQSAGHNKKPANGMGRPRAKERSMKQPLAGGECSRRGDQAAASTRDERIKNTLSPGGPRMPNEPSGQVAAPTQGTARVRFEFAGRAHRREFTRS